MSESTLKQKASRIQLLALDVDGTLTDGGVYIDANGVESKKFHIRDGMGITLLNEKGIAVGLLSHSKAERIISERAKMLNIGRIYFGKEPKLSVLSKWMNELNLTFEQVAYIGDDVNDLELLEKVGLSACPHDAHFSLIQKVDVVLQRNGGHGCVREFIDRFLLPV